MCCPACGGENPNRKTFCEPPRLERGTDTKMKMKGFGRPPTRVRVRGRFGACRPVFPSPVHGARYLEPHSVSFSPTKCRSRHLYLSRESIASGRSARLR